MIVSESFVVADWTNPGTHPGRPIARPTHLLVMTPRIHRLIECLHSGERTDYRQIFLQHESELLEPGP
jgi:hypothetical protein